MSVFPKKYLLVVVILTSQVLLSILGGLALASTPRENYLFPGVFISGIDVGGMSRDQAVKVLEKQVNQEIIRAKVVIQDGRRQWSMSYSDLEVKYDIPATVDRALQISRQPGSLLKALDMFRMKYVKTNLKLEYSLNQARLQEFLHKASSEVNVEMQNASINVSNGQLKLSPGITGIELKQTVTADKIKNALGLLQSAPVRMELVKNNPGITAADLKGIKNSVGLGIAVLPRSEAGSKSILAVVEKLNGVLLKPGDAFSLKKAIGSVIKEKDELKFDPAEGQFKPSQGSRVASALYQAVLYSGLEVKERHAHLTAPEFANMGEDAAVALQGEDLRFANNTNSPIYINASIKNNRLIIDLLGSRPAGETMQVSTEVSAAGPQKGWHVQVYRIFYKSGVEAGRVLVSDDIYH